MANEKDTVSKAPSGRPKRTPVGYRNRFEVANKDPNRVYRLVNDTEGRIAEFEAAGYRVEQQSNIKLGAQRIEGKGSLGSEASIPVGGGTRGVLMSIEKEYYDEDQAVKVQAQKEKLAALNVLKDVKEQYGKVDLS